MRRTSCLSTCILTRRDASSSEVRIAVAFPVIYTTRGIIGGWIVESSTPTTRVSEMDGRMVIEEVVSGFLVCLCISI